MLKNPQGPKKLYLTFDDGPNPPHTREILQILKSNAAGATFFVCGKNAERHPETVKKILEQGHALGNHSYSHARKNIFRGAIYDDFLRADSVLVKIAGEVGASQSAPPRLARAPWGKIRGSAKKKLEALGFQFFGWDLHAYDWWQPSAQWMAKRIISRARPGAIILLHDGKETESGVSRSRTSQALKIFLPALARQGYVFEKLG